MNVLIKKNKQKGFTLVELLVVISIMVVLGVIFTNILIDTLRGKNKVNAVNQVKQNGQVVLDKLSNEIRDAEKIVCVGKYSGTGANIGLLVNDTIVIFKNGTFSQFRFHQPFPILAPSTNGYIRKVDFTATDLVNAEPDNPANTVIGSNLCTTVDTPGFGTNLNQKITDTDPKNGVSINILNGENIFEQRGDSVIIKFAGSAGVKAGYAYDVSVKDGGVPFTTSVQTRGIKR